MRSLQPVRIAALFCLTSFGVLSTASLTAPAPPTATKRVLLLHEGAVGFSPIRERFGSSFIRAVRSAESARIEVYEETFETSRFPGPEQFRLARDFLTNKYAGQKIDVIVTMGVPPLALARQTRERIGNPAIVATLSPTGQIDGNDNVTGLQGGFFINGTIDLALTLQPDTQSVIVIDGSLEDDRDLRAEVERQVKARTRPVGLVYLQDLPLSDVVSRVAAAPEHSVVLFIKQNMRTRSQPMSPFDTLAEVVRASRVPVFSQVEEYVGLGILGGYVWDFEVDAGRMAEMAVRLATGASVRDVPSGRNTYKTLLDWRQLQRWRISESRLPAEAIVLFRQQSFFEQYRRYVVGGMIVFVAQLALIVGLLVERAWRLRAEAEAQRTRDNLAHFTRVSAMGELAASLAHELNQPLTAILTNAQAASRLLAAPTQLTPQLKEILQDIVDDDKRATAVIGRMRELVSKHVTERGPVDMNEIIHSVMKLVASDAAFREVSIDLELATARLTVEGDRVQLQQVILNLVLNALEATSASDRSPRRAIISTSTSDSHSVHVAVRDNGPGLSEGNETQVFEPFFTTKGSGMGMGLSIARSIIESHGGKIWARNGSDTGAEFHFTIPRLATAPSGD